MANPPKTWFETFIAMFWAGTSLALPMRVTEPAVMLAWEPWNHGLLEVLMVVAWFAVEETEPEPVGAVMPYPYVLPTR